MASARRDYYDILGVEPGRVGQGDQVRLQAARARAASGRLRPSRGAGAVPRGGRSLRGAFQAGDQGALRPLRPRRSPHRGVPPERLHQHRRPLLRLLRRRALRGSRPRLAPGPRSRRHGRGRRGARGGGSGSQARGPDPGLRPLPRPAGRRARRPERPPRPAGPAAGAGGSSPSRPPSSASSSERRRVASAMGPARSRRHPVRTAREPGAGRRSGRSRSMSHPGFTTASASASPARAMPGSSGGARVTPTSSCTCGPTRGSCATATTSSRAST